MFGLADVVDVIGQNAFPPRLAAFCEPASGMSSTVVALFKAGKRPRHLFDNLRPSDEARTIRPYFDGPYLLDPFFELTKGNAKDGVYQLRDISPDEFEESEYFNTYFRRTRIEEEVGILIRLDPDTHMLVSFGSREGENAIPALAALTDLLPVVSALCRKHWEIWLSREPDGAATFAASLDNAYRNFGKTLLTDREREVMMLLLKGHSGKSMARALNISPETIKIHRRNLYTKVDVSTQSELFSVFLESLATIPIGSDDDPLERYQRT